jgi:uncharacterized protein
MDNFDNITGFDWDKHNSEKIFQKHKITIKEAESIFADSKFVLSGARISGNETRYAIMGTSGRKKLIGIFTTRKNKIRIISARSQSR